MACSKDPGDINIKIDDDALKQVPKLKYLWGIITEHEKIKKILYNELKKLKLCLVQKATTVFE